MKNYDGLMANVLSKDSPCMIARLGSIELKCVLYGKYPFLLWPFKKYIFRKASNNSGFF